MAVLPEDHYLCVSCYLMLFFYPLLQLQNHWTCGIYYLYVISCSKGVGLWRLAMGTQEHLDIMKPLEIFMVYSDESHTPKSLALHAIMNYITEAVERPPSRKFFLGLAYRRCHAEAEPTTTINLYL